MLPNEVANFILTTKAVGSVSSFNSQEQQFTFKVTAIVVSRNFAPLSDVFYNLLSFAVQENIRSLGNCLRGFITSNLPKVNTRKKKNQQQNKIGSDLTYFIFI